MLELLSFQISKSVRMEKTTVRLMLTNVRLLEDDTVFKRKERKSYNKLMA